MPWRSDFDLRILKRQEEEEERKKSRKERKKEKKVRPACSCSAYCLLNLSLQLCPLLLNITVVSSPLGCRDCRGHVTKMSEEVP